MLKSIAVSPLENRVTPWWIIAITSTGFEATRIRQIPMGFVTLHKAKKQKGDDFLRMLLDDSVVNMFVVGVGEGMVPGKYDKLNSDHNIGAALFAKALGVTAHGGL